jgi:hypothetical protein
MMEAAMPACKSMFPVLCYLLLPAAPALSYSIAVPNGSFESPYVDMVSPYATSVISDWQKAPPPAWWTGAGYSAQQWAESAGTFVGVPFAPISNLDGRQAAFMFATPGVELFQDLTATFEVGKSYHLTVGIEGGGYGMQLGCPMEIRLYYRDENSNRITLAATEATNTNATGVMSRFTDYQLDIPAVAISDPWVGQTIGVQLISTASFDSMGGYWDIDNVRLTAALPEPHSITLLTVGLGVFLTRSWRRRKVVST